MSKIEIASVTIFITPITCKGIKAITIPPRIGETKLVKVETVCLIEITRS